MFRVFQADRRPSIGGANLDMVESRSRAPEGLNWRCSYPKGKVAGSWKRRWAVVNTGQTTAMTVHGRER